MYVYQPITWRLPLHLINIHVQPKDDMTSPWKPVMPWSSSAVHDRMSRVSTAIMSLSNKLLYNGSVRWLLDRQRDGKVKWLVHVFCSHGSPSVSAMTCSMRFCAETRGATNSSWSPQLGHSSSKVTFIYSRESNTLNTWTAFIIQSIV